MANYPKLLPVAKSAARSDILARRSGRPIHESPPASPWELFEKFAVFLPGARVFAAFGEFLNLKVAPR